MDHGRDEKSEFVCSICMKGAICSCALCVQAVHGASKFQGLAPNPKKLQYSFFVTSLGHGLLKVTAHVIVKIHSTLNKHFKNRNCNT